MVGVGGSGEGGCRYDAGLLKVGVNGSSIVSVSCSGDGMKGVVPGLGSRAGSEAHQLLELRL